MIERSHEIMWSQTTKNKSKIEMSKNPHKMMLSQMFPSKNKIENSYIHT